MKYPKANEGGHRDNKIHRNKHIPSQKQVFGGGECSYVPTSQNIHRPIKNTDRLARLWAQGKIKTEVSEDR